MKNHETYAGRYGADSAATVWLLASLAVLVLICGSAVLAPVIAPYDPEAIVGPFEHLPEMNFCWGRIRLAAIC